VTRTNIGTEAMTRTSHRVSIGPACVEAAVGNQSIARPMAMPIADAMTPMTTSGMIGALSRREFLPAGSPALRAPCSPVSSPGPMRARSYAYAPTDGNAVPETRQARHARPPRGAGSRGSRRRRRRRRCATRRPCRCARRRRRWRPGAACGARRGSPRGRRRGGGGRPWRTARLAVADAVGDLADGEAADRQQLGGPLHADAGQVVAEGRAADLGVRALQLAARGRHAARDVVEGELGLILGLDDLHGVLEEARAVADRAGALDGHRLWYGADPHEDDGCGGNRAALARSHKCGRTGHRRARFATIVASEATRGGSGCRCVTA
jgi:hypothetical protein